jgi:uncharacterized membrane protein YjgN (DUF898 family)
MGRDWRSEGSVQRHGRAREESPPARPPPPPSRPPPPPPTPSKALPLAFAGRAGSYFAIWIVNLLLTILTLGIWSAWAKVRRKRYFLGTTTIDGDAFDYLADGWTILKGRLIVAAATAVYVASQSISPYLQGGLVLLYLVSYPWIVNSSLRFNARMTVWRNVRFDFAGSYWGAMFVFLVMPVVGMASFGLLLPVATRLGANYLARHSRCGTAPFHASPALAPFYIALLQTLAILIAALFIIMFVIGVAVTLAGATPEDPIELIESIDVSYLTVMPLVMLAGFMLATNFYRARVRNIVVRTLTLNEHHRFDSVLSGLHYAWIVLSNGIVSIASLGLLHPWAAVRAWRYQAACLSVMPAAALDAFVGQQQDSGAALGSEFVDLQGLEIGL